MSWYLVALAMWRGVLPAFAQMRDGAATALALALGVGVGFTNVGAATGYFLKWGTAWGNFPYFVFGAFWGTPRRYRVARDAWAGAGQRARRRATGVAIIGCYMALVRGVVCVRRVAVGGVEERAFRGAVDLDGSSSLRRRRRGSARGGVRGRDARRWGVPRGDTSR